MKKPAGVAATAALSFVLLVGCAPTDDSGAGGSPSPTKATTTPTATEPSPSAAASEESAAPSQAAEISEVEVLREGFVAQSDGTYAEGFVVLRAADSADVAGKSVIVTMDFLDSAGVVAYTDQVAQTIWWPGQTLIFETTGMTGGSSIATTITLVPASSGDPREALVAPTNVALVEAPPITSDDSQNLRDVGFDFTNPSGTALEEARVGVVCWNGEGIVVGGDSLTFASDYPEDSQLGVPGASHRMIVEEVFFSENPTECAAAVNYVED